MIEVRTVDAGILKTDFKTDLTVDQLVQKVRDEHKLEIRGGYSLQEIKTGHVLDPADPVFDGRSYYLTAWLIRHF